MCIKWVIDEKGEDSYYVRLLLEWPESSRSAHWRTKEWTRRQGWLVFPSSITPICPTCVRFDY